MRLLQARGWVLPIAMLLPIGCGNSASTDGAANTATAPATATAAAKPTVTATATASATAAPERPHRRARRGFGVAAMLLHSAEDLTLNDTQKATVEKLGASLHGVGPRKEIKELHESQIAGVKAGKIDTAKLTATYDAIDKAVAERHDKEIEALNGLHAALEPAQRKALVAAVRAKQAEREARMAEREKKGGEADWSKRHVEHLTKELDLDAAQQKSVAALLEKDDHPTAATMTAHREEAKKRMDALLTAFEGDTFDAKKLELAGPGKKLRDRLEHHLQFLSQLVPVLKPEQREKLAAAMQKHSAVKNEWGAQHDDDHAYHPVFDDQPAEEEAPKP